MNGCRGGPGDSPGKRKRPGFNLILAAAGIAVTCALFVHSMLSVMSESGGDGMRFDGLLVILAG